MTGKAAAEAGACRAEDTASEPTEGPTQPSEEVAASEAPVAAPRAPAPTGAEPAPPSEGDGGGGGGEGEGRRAGGPCVTCLPRRPSSDVPSAPLGLTVEDVSDRAVTVSWEPPERLGHRGLQGYVLELRREGGEPGPAWGPEEPGLGQAGAPR